MINKKTKDYLLIGVALIALIALIIIFIPESSNTTDQDKNCRYEDILKQGNPRNEWVFVGDSNGYWNGEKEVVGNCKDCFRDLHYSVHITNIQEDSLKFKRL